MIFSKKNKQTLPVNSAVKWIVSPEAIRAMWFVAETRDFSSCSQVDCESKFLYDAVSNWKWTDVLFTEPTIMYFWMEIANVANTDIVIFLFRFQWISSSTWFFKIRIAKLFFMSNLVCNTRRHNTNKLVCVWWGSLLFCLDVAN